MMPDVLTLKEPSAESYHYYDYDGIVENMKQLCIDYERFCRVQTT